MNLVHKLLWEVVGWTSKFFNANVIEEEKKRHQNREEERQISEEILWLLVRSRCTVGRLAPSDIAGLLCQRTLLRLRLFSKSHRFDAKNRI